MKPELAKKSKKCKPKKSAKNPNLAVKPKENLHSVQDAKPLCVKAKPSGFKKVLLGFPDGLFPAESDIDPYTTKIGGVPVNFCMLIQSDMAGRTTAC